MNIMKKGLVIGAAIAVLAVLVLLVATPATSYVTTTRYYNMTVEEKNIEYAPGLFFTAWTYNGNIPGPVIRANVGDTIKITLTNKAKRPHSFNTHGLEYDPKDDGSHLYPGSIVQPGKSYTYTYIATRPGLYPYHCHVTKHNDTYPESVHVQQGLQGVVIIDDPANPLPPAKEYVLILNEVYGRPDESIGHGCSYCSGSSKYFAFNSRQSPLPQALNVQTGAIENPNATAGQLVRFYVTNLGNDIHTFHLHGNPMYKRTAASWGTTQLVDGDNVDLLTGSTAVLEVTPKAGKWLYHCHMVVHADNGMVGVFTVT